MTKPEAQSAPNNAPHGQEPIALGGQHVFVSNPEAPAPTEVGELLRELILSAYKAGYGHGHGDAADGMAWVPARPCGYPSLWHRIKAAWLVFTGKADAVLWEGGQ